MVAKIYDYGTLIKWAVLRTQLQALPLQSALQNEKNNFRI